MVAQICQCWQRWWFDGDIQGEQRRRGRPECNAHGGRSAATAPRLSRRFSNRFSWLRKKCLWTFSHLHRPIPSSLRFYVKNVVFVNITKILLIFVWRRVWRQSVSPVWLPNIFHHLILSQDGFFWNISSNFLFLVSIKKVLRTSREMVRTLVGLLIVRMNKTNTYHPQEEFLIQIIVSTIMNIISFILTEQVMSSIDLWQCQQKQAMV